MRLSQFENKRFGELLVLELGYRKNNRVYWKCVCDCGEILYTSSDRLNSGSKQCCRKCSRAKNADKYIKHGGRHTRLYSVWCNMKTRCNNPNTDSSKHYYHKGITICNEWAGDFGEFKDWALLNGWEEQAKDVPFKCLLSIDRIDSNKGYCPNNCRIITVSQNSTNANIERWGKYHNKGENI